MKRIQDAIRYGEYDLTIHSNEEMAKDNLGIFDLEAAVLDGEVVKVETNDPRGARYTIVGRGVDRITLVGVVGRFKETGIFLIITVYEVTD